MEDDLNPYAPPQSDSIVLPPANDGVLPLASRGARLVAVLIDFLILTVILFILQGLTGTLQRRIITSPDGGVAFHYTLADTWHWKMIGLAIWAVINWIFLQNGQTVGKYFLKLQVQRKNGAKADPVRLLLHRHASIILLAMLPYIGWAIAILDALLIFRHRRNTLHDDIADTKVVKLPKE